MPSPVLFTSLDGQCYALKMNLTVSALVASYNEIATLPEVLTKLLALSQISEIVVVDDGSNDGTETFLKDY
ncbi:glycosyltransferase, partial [bacterium]|nr:glycosyltransferase [bacterium]